MSRRRQIEIAAKELLEGDELISSTRYSLQVRGVVKGLNITGNMVFFDAPQPLADEDAAFQANERVRVLRDEVVVSTAANRNAKSAELAKTAPRTAMAVDRPMVGVVDILDYRTQQVQALVDVSAQMELDRAKLLELLKVIAQCTKDSDATKQWMEDHAKILLHDLGEM